MNRNINKAPARVRRGFTLIELMIVVCIIGILVFAIRHFFVGGISSSNMYGRGCAIVGAPGR